MLGRKRIFKGEEVRSKLIAGADKLALAVCSTLGPYGKTVALERQYNPPHITKDGVTVAKEIILEDQIENISAQVLREASAKTAKEAGDGTTSTVLLANELIKRGYELVDKYGSKIVSDVLLEATEYIVKQLYDNYCTPIKTKEEIKNVALISSNGDEAISNLVTEIFDLLGKDGQVIIKEGNSYDTKIEVTKGIMFEKSFASMYFHKPDATKTKITDARLLVTDLNINTVQDAIVLQTLQEQVNKPLVVICGDISDIALECLVYGYKRGSLVYPIRGPFIAQAKEEALLDISIATGATFLSMKEGWNLDNVNTQMTTDISCVEVDYNNTVILPNRESVDNDLFDSRIKYYQEKIMQDTAGLKPNYEKRLAMINAGTGIVYVGGSSEVDITEKKDRLDDTICAVRSALKKGISVGGGVTYMFLGEALCNGNFVCKYEDILWLLEDVLNTPSAKIRENGNVDILHIDPSKVIEPSLVIEQVIRNSIQAAIMILGTDVVVIDVEKEDKFNPIK